MGKWGSLNSIFLVGISSCAKPTRNEYAVKTFPYEPTSRFFSLNTFLKAYLAPLFIYT
jgi:hypothetical protein